MNTKIIEMYRPSHYKSWEEADHMGEDDRLMWRFKHDPRG